VRALDEAKSEERSEDMLISKTNTTGKGASRQRGRDRGKLVPYYRSNVWFLLSAIHAASLLSLSQRQAGQSSPSIRREEYMISWDHRSNVNVLKTKPTNDLVT
jgi:hypothetical protein